MHNGKVNKTRYDDLGKPMKQTSFTVKKKKKKKKKPWGETFPKSNLLQ